jgi:spore coat polysaccharide biosynthesis protein SpsF
MSGTVTCIIQARMGSTRLPGKVLADLGGQPLLAFMLDRLKPLAVNHLIDHLVVATSTDPRDDPVAAAAEGLGVSVSRGPEADVLRRFAITLERFPADAVVRLTADCPLIDPRLVEDVVDAHRSTGADYTSNTLIRTYPDGLDVEVISAAAIDTADRRATAGNEREHVTPYIYRRPETFALRAVRSGMWLADERWTVDTAEDLDYLRGVVARLGSGFAWQSVLLTGHHRCRPAGLLSLQPAGSADHDDPGNRAWTVRADGHDLGRLGVRVRAGVGDLASDLPGLDVTTASQALTTLLETLRADYQVVRLQTAADAANDEALMAAGFRPTSTGELAIDLRSD